MPTELMASVLDDAHVVSEDHTGVGYFLTVRHPELPVRRTVCSQPMLTWTCGEIGGGFVIFLEDRELTLECFTWDDSVPFDIRERHVEVVIEPGSTSNKTSLN